jgi:hypothetical protein
MPVLIAIGQKRLPGYGQPVDRVLQRRRHIQGRRFFAMFDPGWLPTDRLASRHLRPGPRGQSRRARHSRRSGRRLDLPVEFPCACRDAQFCTVSTCARQLIR